MGRRWRFAAAVGMAWMAAGCWGDASGVTAGDLYGLWGAISMEYTSHADAGVRLDIVGTEGATHSIQLISGGTYESTLAVPGRPTHSEAGTFEVRNGRLLLAPETGPDRTLDIDFNQSLLTLVEADTEWDFDEDGTAEPAELEMVLDRF